MIRYIAIINKQKLPICSDFQQLCADIQLFIDSPSCHDMIQIMHQNS